MTALNINLLQNNAFNSHGFIIDGFIKTSDEEDENIYYLYENETGKKLGYIDFDVLKEKKIIFINDMENYVRRQNYKGIGSLLYEFVFYYLSQNNVSFPVQLTTAHGSQVFHFKNGFRFKNESDNQRMEEIIKKGPTFYANKKNIQNFPETMIMSLDILNQKKEKYTVDTIAFKTLKK